MNWDDPAARAALIESVGADEYNRQFQNHQKESTIVNINGHPIRPIGTRFGRLFQVGGTNKAFQTLEQAVAYASTV